MRECQYDDSEISCLFCRNTYCHEYIYCSMYVIEGNVPVNSSEQTKLLYHYLLQSCVN